MKKLIMALSLMSTGAFAAKSFEQASIELKAKYELIAKKKSIRAQHKAQMKMLRAKQERERDLLKDSADKELEKL